MTGAEINTFEVVSTRGSGSDSLSALEIALRDIGIENAKAFSTQVYTLAGHLDSAKLKPVSDLVHHWFNQGVVVNQPLQTEKPWDFAVNVDFQPGVTDNSARVLKSDLGLENISGVETFTSNVHYIKGEFNQELRDLLERVASNPQVHNITILSREEFEKQGGFRREPLPVKLPDRPNYFDIDLGAMDDEELTRTGKLGTLNLDFVKPGMSQKQIEELRGGTLSLVSNLPGNDPLDYMHAIQAYTSSELHTAAGRKTGVLTDTELELFAQMWSEHCRHSLYNAAIPGTNKGIFDTFIKEPTLEVLKKKPHLGVSIYKDNSGVFEFDENWNVCVKNETHNSPSALDPYGGSMTGIVGVNRDPFGTGIGGEVIANLLGYILGHPEDRRKYFKRKVTNPKCFTLEELMLNPKQIFEGVVTGVEEGANQMGIALNLGNCTYHDRYNGKPIVKVASIGRQPKTIMGQPAHQKRIDPGDRLYIAGGRAGRDGIHGATFSSEALTAISPAKAVQLGDPYTQRKLFEALLEARDKGYIKFMTDLGAGGVSCAALEMGANVTMPKGQYGGLEIDLDKLLVKYQGMTATELFMNESQERMAIAVLPEHAEAFEAILREHEVEYSDIGRFTDSGRAIVHSKNKKVVDLNMKFIHEGFPDRVLAPEEYRLSKEEQLSLEAQLENAIDQKHLDHEDPIKTEFYEMLRRPNLGSHAHFLDKMDSTVKGLSVQHCIQGRGRVSTRAACILVDIKSTAGLIESYGFAERQAYIDSKKMGKNEFFRAIGNALAMGGRLDYMVATDQALWQSSNDPKYQQMLIEANEGMSQVIKGCDMPVISGKDSMYNQAKIFDEQGREVQRGVFPSIDMYVFAKIDDVDDLVTIDAKDQGDLVYVVGAVTKADMGGSEYFNKYSEETGIEFNIGQVSDETPEDVFDTFEKMDRAQKQHLLKSAKYIENGGLATTIKETAKAGELGIELDITKVHQVQGLELHEQLYSETEGRFVVTIDPKNQEQFEKLFQGKYSQIGAVKGDSLTIKDSSKTLLNEPVQNLLKEYHRTT